MTIGFDFTGEMSFRSSEVLEVSAAEAPRDRLAPAEVAASEAPSSSSAEEQRVGDMQCTRMCLRRELGCV